MLTVLTSREGKRIFVARGVKNIRSKQSSSLQPGAAGYIWWTRGKKNDIIVSAETVAPLSAQVRQESVYALRVIAAFVAQASALQVPEPRVFNALLDVIKQTRQGKPLNVLVHVRSLLSLLGWSAPQDTTDIASFIEQHLNIPADYVRSYQRIASYKT